MNYLVKTYVKFYKYFTYKNSKNLATLETIFLVTIICRDGNSVLSTFTNIYYITSTLLFY
jgi:hypothetical protein